MFLLVVKTLGERIHLRLELIRIIHQPRARFGGVENIAELGTRLLPRFRVAPGKIVNKVLHVVGHFEVGARGSEQKDLRAHLGDFRLLPFDGPMRGQERDNVKPNQREGNNGPATAFHVFVFQRNQQHCSLKRRSAEREMARPC